MTEPTVVSAPVPFMSVLLCLGIAFRIYRLDQGVFSTTMTRSLFTMLFLIFASLSFLVGIRFGYGIDDFRWLQRILPFAIGPITYFGFYSFVRSDAVPITTVIRHFGCVAICMFIFAFDSHIMPFVDLAIAVSYAIYSGFLLSLFCYGGDEFVDIPLSRFFAIRKWGIGAAILLIFMLITDSAVSFYIANGEDQNVEKWLSAIVLFTNLLLCALVVWMPHDLRINGHLDHRKNLLPTSDFDHELVKRADEFLQASKIYCDPELTLGRLARRLHVSAHQLSNAVNRVEGQNISQFVNGFRIRHAVEELKQDESTIMSAMERSGFLTKSNFYREFKRIHGLSPAEFRMKAQFDDLGE